jgi:hypothetical protein
MVRQDKRKRLGEQRGHGLTSGRRNRQRLSLGSAGSDDKICRPGGVSDGEKEKEEGVVGIL